MTEKTHLNFSIFAMIGCIVLVSVSSTTTHIVGDNMGWSMPKYPGFYNDWAKSRTFAVGDVLLFKYKPGLNTVAQIGSKEDYCNCSSINVIHTFSFGNSRVTLDKPGSYFFFSSVGKHCEAGQKLWVTVPQGNNPTH